MEKSRTKNTIKNVKTSFIVQIINKIVRFFVRTIFIKVLSTEYLGVNGLFTNILTILSFTELGIGTAITFNLYEPIANEDKDKIKSLMNLYKKCYSIVAIAMFGIGLCVIPFLDFIIKEPLTIKEEISYIYILFLLNTSISYCLSYKKSIIIAYQQENIINKIRGYCEIGKSILEILFLILTQNYIVYLIIQISWTIIENISVANKANNMFPYLKEKGISNLPKDEKKNIFYNVKSLFIYKFGTAVMDGSDNILISSLVNVNMVGILSNYTLLLITVKEVLILLLNDTVIASVGNLNAIGKKERKEEVFHELTFISFWIYGLCAIVFYILVNPFIEIWLGSEYLLNMGISLTLSINFFICGLRTPCYTYKTALGLFKKSQYTPYVGLIANITFSIILYKFLGTIGIFIATIIAELVSYSWMDPYVIYKYGFNSSAIKYLKKYLIYIVVFISELFISMVIMKIFNIYGILGTILKLIVSFVIINLLNWAMFYKTEEYAKIKEKIIVHLL